MSYDTFTWCPLVGAQGQSSFRVFNSQFGDGYRQVTGDGINNRTQSWPLEFKGTKDYIQAIKTFLDNHQGVKPFYWTPPMEDQGLYDAGQYQILVHHRNLYTLSVTFTQRFEP